MNGRILLIQGPNLNLLGTRQPEIYGSETLEDVERLSAEAARGLGFSLTQMQSNHEGVLVDTIQAARGTADAIIINPAAYSHTSVAILDALNMFDGPVVEVHISDIHAREPFRHHSYVSHRADAVIVGQGVKGYCLAVEKVAELSARNP